MSATNETRFKLIVDYKTEWFSKDDFKSETKWIHFKNYMIKSRKIAKNNQRNANRLKKSLTSSRDVIKDLRACHCITADERAANVIFI